MKTLDIIVGALLIVGGLNLGLVGLFDFNLVSAIFGEMTVLTRIVYIMVGLSALYDLVMLKAITQRWDIHFKRPVHA